MSDVKRKLMLWNSELRYDLDSVPEVVGVGYYYLKNNVSFVAWPIEVETYHRCLIRLTKLEPPIGGLKPLNNGELILFNALDSPHPDRFDLFDINVYPKSYSIKSARRENSWSYYEYELLLSTYAAAQAFAIRAALNHAEITPG